MKKPQFRVLLIFVVFGALFSLIQLAYAEVAVLQNVIATGECYVRDPGQVNFSLPVSGNYLSVNAIVTVKPDVGSSVATGSKIIIGSHTLFLFPGSTVRLLAEGIYPLAGRFELNTASDSEALQITTRKFSAAYKNGNLLMEITPDNGTYAALRNKGDVWFKDGARRIFDLQSGQQLYFPLYGETVEQDRLSGFWTASPTSFAAVRPRTAFQQNSVSDKEELSNAPFSEKLEDETQSDD